MEEKDINQQRIKLLIDKWKLNQNLKKNENLKNYLEKYRDKIEKKISDFTMKDVHRKYTVEELLDSIDIEKINLYLRNKKLNKIKNNISK